jgi:hypothetical protein
MSLVVDERGGVWVLDQINGRLVRFGDDGKVLASVPMDRPTAQDIARGADGSMAVLDRFGGQEVALLDPEGNPLGTLPLVGDHVESAGLVTGVFVDGEDVLVEVEHGPLVKIGDTSGAPAQPREEVLGRPTRDGKSWIKAGITDPAAGRAYVASNIRPSGEHRFTRELQLDTRIWSIVLLDSDRAGTLYFAAEIEQEGAENAILLTCLDPASGAPVGSALLPANTMPEESFRDLVVLDEGGVVFAHRTEEGVSYEQYECE